MAWGRPTCVAPEMYGYIRQRRFGRCLTRRYSYSPVRPTTIPCDRLGSLRAFIGASLSVFGSVRRASSGRGEDFAGRALLHIRRSFVSHTKEVMRHRCFRVSTRIKLRKSCVVLDTETATFATYGPVVEGARLTGVNSRC